MNRRDLLRLLVVGLAARATAGALGEDPDAVGRSAQAHTPPRSLPLTTDEGLPVLGRTVGGPFELATGGVVRVPPGLVLSTYRAESMIPRRRTFRGWLAAQPESVRVQIDPDGLWTIPPGAFVHRPRPVSLRELRRITKR